MGKSSSTSHLIDGGGGENQQGCGGHKDSQTVAQQAQSGDYAVLVGARLKSRTNEKIEQGNGRRKRRASLSK